MLDLSQKEITEVVDKVMRERKSVRAFLPTPIPEEEIRALLQVAARAPSGSNIQPWHVYVVSGDKQIALGAEMLEAFLDPEKNKLCRAEYDYYPKNWIEPFLSRRRKVGFALYDLLGIGKGDRSEMQRQHGRNFTFFDAPVALFFTMNRILEQGSWLDSGMFIQNVMLAAKARGLDTCAQAAFCQYHEIIARHLNIPPDQQLVCGLSLGYEDTSKPENSLISDRENVDVFTTFITS